MTACPLTSFGNPSTTNRFRAVLFRVYPGGPLSLPCHPYRKIWTQGKEEFVRFRCHEVDASHHLLLFESRRFRYRNVDSRQADTSWRYRGGTNHTRHSKYGKHSSRYCGSLTRGYCNSVCPHAECQRCQSTRVRDVRCDHEAIALLSVKKKRSIVSWMTFT